MASGVQPAVEHTQQCTHLRIAMVAAEFCGIQHQQCPSAAQTFAVVAGGHVQGLQNVFPGKAQLMVAKHMVGGYFVLMELQPQK